MSQIGKTIPAFHCEVVANSNITTISDVDLRGKYTVLFFYPLDFTFVCPTEIHALQEALPEFESRNCSVYGVSVDSVHTHRAWLTTPKNEGGVQGVTFPLISDLQRVLSEQCDVLDESGVAQRATIILDTENVIQHISVNNLSLGRNVSEIIRTLDAIKFVAEHGENVCPANWQQGDEVIEPTHESVTKYLSK